LEVRPPEAHDKGTDLLMSAGIHGNETAPIDLQDELIRSIARGDLKPRARILFLFATPDAMRQGTRFDEQDVKRQFN
ncbi:succinylglutamate desuccinylase/aspartoacylase family protein, partial [Pseudomonas syringae pv. tagetis]|uniref:succinylglutamate desuccinylase/aspartoacylase domain-containing protein n=1 Tax=Pseudomonas syringae group genomosp. 7 TaxID=251699 RepID=UPI0037706A59